MVKVPLDIEAWLVASRQAKAYRTFSMLEFARLLAS
jgi:hypothetical protein